MPNCHRRPVDPGMRHGHRDGGMAHRCREGLNMTTDVVLPDPWPTGFHDQQYSRAAMYLSHAAFVENFLSIRNSPALKIVEFGGSNGFVRSLFDCPGYEGADNMPAVDIHDLSRYQPSTFDCVVLDEILEHVERPWEAVDEIHRI